MNFCSCNRRLLELETQLLKGGERERWIRVREPRTLGIHGDEVVDISVSAVAPPPPPPRRRRRHVSSDRGWHFDRSIWTSAIPFGLRNGAAGKATFLRSQNCFFSESHCNLSALS
jgi:hypothetical protein